MTRRIAQMVLFAAFVMMAVSFAPAAEDYLKLVPEGALGVVVVNDLGAVDAKFQSFGRQMQVPVPGIMAMLERFGIQKGIDRKGTAALVVLPPAMEGMPPAPLILVSVADFDSLLEPFEAEKLPDEPVYKVRGFNTVFFVRHIGGYAAVTDSMYRKVLYEKNLKISKEVPADLAAWRQWLAGHDAAGVILRPGIKFISANVQNGLRMMQSSMGSREMEMAAAMFDIYGKFLQSAEQELDGWGFGLTLDKENTFTITDRALLTPGGKWASFVEKMRPIRTNLLAGLPDGPFVAAGGGVFSDSIMDELMKFSMNMMKSMRGVYGLSEEQIDKMTELSRETMKGIRAMSMLVQVGREDEPLYAKMIAVMRVDDSREFMTLYEKHIKRYSEFVGGLDNPMFQPIEVEKCEIAAAAGLQLTIKVPQAPAELQTPQYEQMMKLFYGAEEKNNAWIVPADKHTLVMGFVNKDLLQRTIEAVKQGKPGLAGQPDVKRTAAMLPSDAVAAGYLSPTGLIELLKQIVPTFAPPSAELTFPDFPKTPPVGFAVTTGSNEVQARLVVPGEVIQALIAQGKKMFLERFHQNSPYDEEAP